MRIIITILVGLVTASIVVAFETRTFEPSATDSTKIHPSNAMDVTGGWTGTFDGQEGTFYTNAINLTSFGTPFYTLFSATNTTALTEGNNLYWTNVRFDNRLSASSSISGITTLPSLTSIGTMGSAGQVLSVSGGLATWVSTSTCAQITGSSALCDGDDATGAGGSFPFTATTWGGVNANSTSTLLLLEAGGVISTSSIGNLVSGSLTATSSFTVPGLTSALTLTGAAGLFDEYTGATCTNQFVRSLSALGAATCATVVAGDVDLADLTATDATLTFSGAYDGQTARTVGLNLGNANTWTALQTLTGGLLVNNSTSTITNLVTTNSTSTNATTTNLNVSGTLDVDGLTSALVLTDAGGVFAEYTGATCTNQFIRVLSVLGAATCATVGTLDVAGLDVSDDLNLTAGTNITLTGDDLSVDDVFILNSGDIGTGVYDFGGATSFEIPNGTGPVVDALGECAIDSTDNQLICGDSGNVARVFATAELPLFAVVIASTSPDLISGGAIEIPKWTKDGRDITQFRCHVDGGTSVVVNVSDNGTNDTETITCAATQTSDTNVATNSVFTADELWRLEIGTITGTVDYLVFEAYGYITVE